MRILTALLIALSLLALVASFVVAPHTGPWLPRAVTSTGGEVDGLFQLILWLLAVVFVGTHVFLLACVWRFARASSSRATFTHGNARVELVWTAIPASILAALAFFQLSIWNRMSASSNAPPLARVEAFQFGWRFVHAGPDRAIGTLDDVPASFELVVPADEDVALELVSRDVIHSFFVPSFRLKQDVVPGMTLPVRFRALETGEYDLVCAELCGFGHYKMAGRVRVVTRAAYDAWLVEQARERASNGKDDVR